MICKKCKRDTSEDKGWCYHCNTCEDCLFENKDAPQESGE